MGKFPVNKAGTGEEEKKGRRERILFLTHFNKRRCEVAVSRSIAKEGLRRLASGKALVVEA